MKYIEFIVFIARLAYEVFKGTKQEGIGLHLKCDKVLPPLLDTINATIIFSFKDDDDDVESSESGSLDSKSSKSSGALSTESKKKKKNNNNDESDENDEEGSNLKRTFKASGGLE